MILPASYVTAFFHRLIDSALATLNDCNVGQLPVCSVLGCDWSKQSCQCYSFILDDLSALPPPLIDHALLDNVGDCQCILLIKLIVINPLNGRDVIWLHLATQV